MNLSPQSSTKVWKYQKISLNIWPIDLTVKYQSDKPLLCPNCDQIIECRSSGWGIRALICEHIDNTVILLKTFSQGKCQQNIFNFSILVVSEKKMDNPWKVESLQDLTFICCPECAYRSKDESTFQDHALQNHVLSATFFHEG